MPSFPHPRYPHSTQYIGHDGPPLRRPWSTEPIGRFGRAKRSTDSIKYLIVDLSTLFFPPLIDSLTSHANPNINAPAKRAGRRVPRDNNSIRHDRHRHHFLPATIITGPPLYIEKATTSSSPTVSLYRTRRERKGHPLYSIIHTAAADSTTLINHTTNTRTKRQPRPFPPVDGSISMGRSEDPRPIWCPLMLRFLPGEKPTGSKRLLS